MVFIVTPIYIRIYTRGPFFIAQMGPINPSLGPWSCQGFSYFYLALVVRRFFGGKVFFGHSYLNNPKDLGPSNGRV